MPENTMVGVKRAPDLDGSERNGEVWLASRDLDDMLLPDTDFVPAASWEEALAALEDRYPAPDAELYRVILVGKTRRRLPFGGDRIDLPPRIIVLRGWYWKRAGLGDAERLEELARAFGPIFCWRNDLSSYSDSPAQVLRGSAGYADRNIVVRDWIADPKDRSPDPVVVYAPRAAAAREKGRRTQVARRARECKEATTRSTLTSRHRAACDAMAAAVGAKLRAHLRRTRLKALGDHVFTATGCVDDNPRPGREFAGRLADEDGFGVDIALDDSPFAVAAYRAVFRSNRYRDLPEFAAYLACWREWPAAVPKKDVPAAEAALLDAELAAARRRRPRKPETAAPAAAAHRREEDD